MTDSTAVEVYRPDPVMRPLELKNVLENVEQLKRDVMVEGRDYGQIPGTDGLPTLLKPGAERLLLLFGLGHRFKVLGIERTAAGERVGVTVECTVTRGDMAVASSLGACDYLEPAQSRRRGPPAPWNTILKMAQKRALVGAALHATASSGLFVADYGDDGDDGRPFEACSVDAATGEVTDRADTAG